MNTEQNYTYSETFFIFTSNKEKKRKKIINKNIKILQIFNNKIGFPDVRQTDRQTDTAP